MVVITIRELAHEELLVANDIESAASNHLKVFIWFYLLLKALVKRYLRKKDEKLYTKSQKLS